MHQKSEQAREKVSQKRVPRRKRFTVQAFSKEREKLSKAERKISSLLRSQYLKKAK
jgi:hypothetical protein